MVKFFFTNSIQMLNSIDKSKYEGSRSTGVPLKNASVTPNENP